MKDAIPLRYKMPRFKFALLCERIQLEKWKFCSASDKNSNIKSYLIFVRTFLML